MKNLTQFIRLVGLGRFLFYTALSAVAGFLEYFSLAAILPLVQALSMKGNPQELFLKFGISLPTDWTRENIILIMLAGLFLIFMLKTIYTLSYTYFLQKYLSQMSAKMSTELLQFFLTREYSYFFSHNTSEIVRKVTVEVPQVVISLLGSAMKLIVGFVTLVSIVVFLAWVDIQSFLAMSAVIGGLFLLNHLVMGKKPLKLSETRVSNNGYLYNFLMGALNAVREIKIFNKEKFFIDRFQAKRIVSAEIETKVEVFRIIPKTLSEIAVIIAISIPILFVLIGGGDESRLVPLLTLFAVSAYRAIPALNIFLSSLHSIQFSYSNLTFVLPDLNKMKMKQEENTASQEPVSKREIKNDLLSGPLEVQNLTFRYSSEEPNPVLRNVSLKFSLGKVYGIVGKSGSGKSTLVNIILGLLEPENGTVNFNGIETNSQDGTQLKNLIGYVPQTIYLVDGSLAENVAFGLDFSKSEESLIMDILKRVGLTSFVEQLPKGLHTHIGENGIKLSGGQRQRLGIARALYKNPKILILDEATSSLDGQTEYLINKEIVSQMHDKITLVIAHRLSTIKYCDYIYLLDSGLVAAEGSFDSLYNSNSLFQSIANIENEYRPTI